MFKNKNCLVTGGTGMIGRQVVKKLCDMGARVKIASMDNLKVDSRADHNIVDLTLLKNCLQITQNMDYVFHLAGVKGSPKVTAEQPSSFFVPMLMFNTNVLEACRINSVERVVYTSSIGAYAPARILSEDTAYDGSPMDTYPGWAKRMGELQIQTYEIQYGLKNFSVVRIGTTYGPGDNFDPANAMVIPSLMAKIMRGDDPVEIWGDGSAVRDFAYSGDIADGIIQVLIANIGSQVVNLGGGQGYSIKQLVGGLHSFLVFNSAFDPTKPTGVKERILSIELAKKLIGYEPQTSLIVGLVETWEWYSLNREEYKLRKNYFNGSMRH
ncbi:hypothetical protein LCGC14_1646720 [marine sediment metagenome]|uniref:NAD-dependent epimerase/dehydratase domain-containing protein n=1 Tax=marine sediment metagenome TaxID=412755 RepID=A0A0F9HYR9_9ZZZZ